MKSLLQFLGDFFKNKGQYIFISLLVGKICAFLSSLLIIRWLPEYEFGKISLVAAVFVMFSSASGLGSYQSLLRFGSIAKDDLEKNAISSLILKQGFFYHLILSAFFLICSLFFVKSFQDIFFIFLFFGIRLVGVYFQNHIQSYLRMTDNNRDFARSNNVINVVGLSLVLLLTYYFKIYGYLFAMAFSPFLSLFWFKKEMFSSKISMKFSKKEIWNYAFHTAGTTFFSDALFAIDVILLGFLANENTVANYRVAILIPANLTFLALVFLQTDFPVLAKNFQNKMYLRNYISNYYKVFIPICFLIFIVFWIFSEPILHLFFSEKYLGNQVIFLVLTAAFLFNMLFRNLYGNLLASVGKMKVNTFVSVFSLILLIVLSFVLVPNFQEKGMAFAISATMFISGILLMFNFYKYLRSLQ